MTKADVAREYRAKHGDKMPTLKLARIMYKKNNQLFTTVDDARSTLRYIEGKLGEKNRKRTNLGAFVKEEARPYNPYKLPDSDESDFKPYILKGHKRVAVFADIHAPYHSITAITAALNFCKKDKVDALVLNGDAWDFHGLSKYMKDPRKKNFPEEIRVGVELFTILEKQLKCPIYYKLGNHCERYQHYLWQKLGELQGLEDFEFESILKKRLPGITVIGDKRIIKAGELNIVHGHEFASSIISPVNIARGLYLRAKSNAICGHHHRSSEHTEQDINGKIITTWSTGCLSELHPHYMPINSWNHGFAIVDLHGSKEFEVRNKRIWEGKVL